MSQFSFSKDYSLGQEYSFNEQILKERAWEKFKETSMLKSDDRA